MDELFDSFKKYTFPSESTFLKKKDQNVSATVQNDQKIIEQLCKLTEDSNQLREEIDSLNDDCNNSNKSHCIGDTHNWDNSNDSGFKLKDPPDVNEILSTNEASITSTPHNVGVLNAACQQILKEMELQLLSLLKKNRKEQEIVLNFLVTNGKSKFSENPKKFNYKCMGMPYFKDLDGYPPPFNEDVLSKKRDNKLLPSDFLNCSAVWTNIDSKNLIVAVNESLKNIPGQIPDYNTIDWMKISAVNMDGKYSPSECKSKWFLNLSPTVNKAKWEPKETKLLKSIAEKFKYQDWTRIAEELKTNRTDFQCCVQYHSHRSTNGRKWSAREDEKLKELVEKYKLKDIIPWQKVAWHFEERSLRQCQERYFYHLTNIKKGSFSKEEDFVLVYLATKLKNFGEVAKYLPKRVSTQIRSRYEYLVQLSMPEFTKEEDDLLIKLMTKYPRNWGKISEHFKNRSKLQCRKRWDAIQKSIKLDNDEFLDSHSEAHVNIKNKKMMNKSKNETRNEMIDTINIKKNFMALPEFDTSRPKYKKSSDEYNKLLEYLKPCYKFLFGPKPRISLNPEDANNLCTKMRVSMKILSVSPTVPLSSFDVKSLSSNCEFDEEDVIVLTELENTSSSNYYNTAVKVSNKIVPPNYMTLVGLRTLTLSWKKLIEACDDDNNDKLLNNSPEDDLNNRLLFGDAKKLFQSRVKTLFALPMILSNTAQESKPIYKLKAKKNNKPLSKQKRREHAKLMSKLYHAKLRDQSKQITDTLEYSNKARNFSSIPSEIKGAEKLGKSNLVKETNISGTLELSDENSTSNEDLIAYKRKRGRPCKNKQKLMFSKKQKLDGKQ